MARRQEKAQKQGRTIVFVDETGVSERPHRCRTWAPRGQTPVLQFNFNSEKLSAAAGITFHNFYFRLYPDAIRGPEVIDFLKALVRRIACRRIAALWCESSSVTRKATSRTEYLPAYAPELNPVEYMWSYWKQHQLPNVARRTTGSSTRAPGRRCAVCASRASSPPSGSTSLCLD